MRIDRRILRAAAAVAAAVAVGASAFAATALGSGAADSTVVALLGQADWTDFDIQVQEQGANAQLVTTGYDRLVSFSGGKYYPVLGTPGSISPRAITFKIRANATCSDGTRLTAKAVHDSFKRLIEVPKLSNFLSNYFGAGPYAVSF